MQTYIELSSALLFAGFFFTGVLAIDGLLASQKYSIVILHFFGELSQTKLQKLFNLPATIPWIHCFPSAVFQLMQ